MFWGCLGNLKWLQHSYKFQAIECKMLRNDTCFWNTRVVSKWSAETVVHNKFIPFLHSVSYPVHGYSLSSNLCPVCSFLYILATALGQKQVALSTKLNINFFIIIFYPLLSEVRKFHLILMSADTTSSTTVARPPLGINRIFFQAELVKWFGTNSTIQHLFR